MFQVAVRRRHRLWIAASPSSSSSTAGGSPSVKVRLLPAAPHCRTAAPTWDWPWIGSRPAVRHRQACPVSQGHTAKAAQNFSQQDTYRTCPSQTSIPFIHSSPHCRRYGNHHDALLLSMWQSNRISTNTKVANAVQKHSVHAFNAGDSPSS